MVTCLNQDISETRSRRWSPAFPSPLHPLLPSATTHSPCTSLTCALCLSCVSISQSSSAFLLFCLGLGLHNSTGGVFPGAILSGSPFSFLASFQPKSPLPFLLLLQPNFSPLLSLCICLDFSASFAPPAGSVHAGATVPVYSGCALPLHMAA